MSHQPINTSQHVHLQHSYIGAWHVHPTRQSRHVHHAHLPPTPQPPRSRAPCGPVRRLPTQPVSTRHERPRQAQPWSAVVHEQRLPVRNALQQRLLYASPRELRCDLRYGVSQLHDHPFHALHKLTIHPNSVIFSLYVIFSVLSTVPTQRERSQRADNIEMKKLDEYRPQTMTRDEQRDMHRQIFLNLPKTPTTPWGRDPSNPMTPRTVAFTQLNGGAGPPSSGPSNGHHMVSSGQGPSRLLPFRQHYGDGVDGS
jgi:hypothetical protein